MDFQNNPSMSQKKPNRYKHPLAIIIYVFGALGTVAGGVKGYIYLKGVVREKVREQVKEELQKIDDAYVDIQLFKTSYKDFLDRSMKYRSVGIYRNEEDGSIKYRHIDGKLYQPLFWPDKRSYYFYKADHTWEMCH